MHNYAKAFRGKSNLLPFMSSDYNAAAVKTTTPKDRQVIFMDAQFNADFDVDVLASAFNMSKADFMGSLFLIDDFTTFDNDRFDIIREESDGLEEITAAELALMANVKALIMDENWFQVYDNLNQFAEKFISSGLRWNYFYHVWKTISVSPFANAIVFVDDSADIAAPATLAYTVSAVDTSDYAKVITLIPDGTNSIADQNMVFVQTEALTALGIAVQPYGAIFVPATALDDATAAVVTGKVGNTTYTATVNLKTVAAGAAVSMAKV